MVALAGCEEEPLLGPSGTVDLHIHALFADNQLSLGEPYLFGMANKIKIDELNFFISNVKLLEEETTDETDLLDIAFADFSDNTSGTTESFSFRAVPAVKYRGFKISIGVPSSLNKSSVSGYGAGHPLKKNFDTHFYSDGNSFYFMKLAGVYDLNGDGIFGTAPEDNPFELFPFKNGNFKTVTILKSFELTDGKSLDLNLNVDILKLLQSTDNQVIDLSEPTNLSTYNPENNDLSALLMGNFETALELE